MSILDNAKYMELGKQAEKQQVVQEVAPQIEKETVRKYAPIIDAQAKEELARQIYMAGMLGRGNAHSSYNGNGLSQLNNIKGY